MLVSVVQHDDSVFVCIVKWHCSKSSYLSPYIVTKIILLVMRTLKIYSLSNFQTQDTILLTFVTVLWQTHYIPMAYLSYNRKCVLLWFHLFIISGVISLLLSSSILSTYQPGEFIFQCHIFLPFHTVHGVLKARILKWFAIPFSSGPHSVRTFHAKMGSIKDRNGMDLTEAEDIKKRWQ